MVGHSTRSATAPDRDLPDVESLRPDLRERRERVIQAAARLMVTEDYVRIQIKDVAVEAGVALGTLYRYFSSKDHVFACALAAWASGFGDRLRHDPDATPVEQVTAVYRRAARAFEREPRVFDMLIQLQGSNDPYAAAVYGEFSRQQTAAFADALEGIDPDERDDIVDVMSAVLAESLRGQQLGLASFEDVHRRIRRTAELILR